MGLDQFMDYLTNRYNPYALPEERIGLLEGRIIYALNDLLSLHSEDVLPSVRRLCLTAKISRNTFYTHYNTVEDVCVLLFNHALEFDKQILQFLISPEEHDKNQLISIFAREIGLARHILRVVRYLFTHTPVSFDNLLKLFCEKTNHSGKGRIVIIRYLVLIKGLYYLFEDSFAKRIDADSSDELLEKEAQTMVAYFFET